MVDVKRPSIDKTQIEFDRPTEAVEAGTFRAVSSKIKRPRSTMLADLGQGGRADQLPLPTFNGEVNDKAQACRAYCVLEGLFQHSPHWTLMGFALHQ